MKKYFLVALMGFVIPSIALAAWWNPFTWFPPKVAPQIFTTSSVATTSVKIVATTTPKIVQKKIIPATPSNNPRPSTSTVSVIKTSIINTPTVTPPTNGTLCNGTYWTACPTGQNFVCPTTGSAYCQVPTPSVSSNQNICNGVTYSSCPSGTDFTCPSNRSGYCAVDPNYYTQQQQQTTQQPTQSPQTNSVSQNTLPSCANGSLNAITNCIRISPTSATGGATTTFTIITSGYRFGSGSLNLATLALQCGSGNNCVGMYPSVPLSADGKSFTYTTYVPDNTSTSFSIGRTELVDSNNQYVNFSNDWLSVPVINSNPNFGAPIPATVSISLDPNQSSTGNGLQLTSWSNTTGVPVMIFDLTPNYNSQVDSISAHFTTTGSGTPTTAYLFVNSNMIGSSAISSAGVASFTNIDKSMSENTAQPFLIRIDANNVTSTTTISATINPSDVVGEDGEGNPTQTTGSVTSAPIIISP